MRYPLDPESSVDDLTNWDSEFAYGAGRFPDPTIDYSQGGSRSRAPIADPDRTAQLLELAEIRRTDVVDPVAPLSPYELGNTDRYGAQPPLVRERRVPPAPARVVDPPTKMVRSW